MTIMVMFDAGCTCSDANALLRRIDNYLMPMARFFENAGAPLVSEWDFLGVGFNSE